MRRHLSAEVVREVRRRAGGLCEYCRTQERFTDSATFEIEHIFPQILGGTNDLWNLALSCPGCNSFKGIRIHGIDPVTEKSVRLFHPRQDVWENHFIWNEDFTRLIGLTARGRATIATLRLNRPGLQNLRMSLRFLGVHPPTSPTE